jgi:ribose-phosphate pyrophosphokinase
MAAGSGSFRFFNTSRSSELTQKVLQHLNTDGGKLFTTRFSDGEVYTRFEESIRGDNVVIVGQVNMPYEHLFELFVTIDGARRASAAEIICLIPYLPHSRQERKDDARSSVSARLIADFLEHSGATRILTLDMHSTSIEGLYTIPIEHLHMSRIFIPDIAEKFSPESLCLCSPDFGGLMRIKTYKKRLNCSMAVVNKERLRPNQVEAMEIIGEVEGKNVVLVDDIVDTGGTLCSAANMVLKMGARSVSAYATHGIFSGNAVEQISNSELLQVTVSDSIPGIIENHYCPTKINTKSWIALAG